MKRFKKIMCAIIGHRYLIVHTSVFENIPGYNSTSTRFQCGRCNKTKTIRYDEQRES